MPTFIFYRDGSKVATIRGADSKSITAKLTELAGSSSDSSTDSKASVELVSSVDAFKKILKDNKGVAVDLFAEWCMPCKQIGPKFAQWSQDDAYKGIKFIKVDVDDAEELAGELEVESMPTFKFFLNGQEVETMVGAKEASLKTCLDNLKEKVSKSCTLLHNRN